MTGTGEADWSRLLPHLSVDFRCVVPDLRGHGRSDFREAGFGYAAMLGVTPEGFVHRYPELWEAAGH